MPLDDRQFLKRTIYVLGLATMTVGIVTIAVIGRSALLLLFASILFAVFLKGCGRQLTKFIKIPAPWDVLLVLTLLFAVTVGLCANFTAHVVEQFQALSEQSRHAIDSLTEKIQNAPEWKKALENMPSLGDVLSYSSGGASSITSWFSTTFGGVLSLLIILVGGTFFAVDGSRYRDGIVLLVPPPYRSEAHDVLSDLGNALERWLLGRFLSMAMIGIATSIILALLRIPMPVTLGTIAALLTFVPNIGAVMGGAIPALLALQQGVDTAIAVIISYFILQMIESYSLTPLVQQHVATLPAALVVFSQILAATLFGILGIALASPLAVVSFVLIKNLYVERLE